MDHHVIVLFALIGMGLDLLGGLFLAYDLFGRRRGPLRTLLRAILYCFIFVAVYSIALDWRFSLVAGIGLGLSFTYELGRRASAVRRSGWTSRATRILLIGATRNRPGTIARIFSRGRCRLGIRNRFRSSIWTIDSNGTALGVLARFLAESRL